MRRSATARPYHYRDTIALLLLALGLVACSSKQAPSGVGDDVKVAAPAGSAPAESGACDEQYSARRRAQLEALCALEGQIAGASLAGVPAGLSTRAPAELIPIELSADAWMIGSFTVEPDDLARKWTYESERARDLARLTGRTYDSGWALTVHKDVKATEVARALAQLASVGAVTGELRLSAPLQQPAPAPADPAFHGQLMEELSTRDASQRAMFLAERIEATVKGCEPITKVFAALASAPASKRCELTAAGFADALRECDCPDWGDKLMTFMHIMTIGVKPAAGALVAVPVQLETAPIDPPSPEMTWADIAAQLQPGARWPLQLSPR